MGQDIERKKTKQARKSLAALEAKMTKTNCLGEVSLEKAEKHPNYKHHIQRIAQDKDESLKYAILTRKRFPEGEQVIATHHRTSYSYAMLILNGPFPQGEKAIAEDPIYSYMYATKVLKGPFPLCENNIGDIPQKAYEYARDVLHGPFPKAEPKIATEFHAAILYAIDVLKGPFIQAEEMILQTLQDEIQRDNHIALGLALQYITQTAHHIERLKENPSFQTIIKHIALQ